MPIAVGLGARRNSCGCPACEESGSDGGSDSGITVGCCAVPIPRRLYASIFCGGSSSFSCAWDGTIVPLDYVYVPAEFPVSPHHWEGNISFGMMDPCGTGTGPGPFSLRVVLKLDDYDSTLTTCYWLISVQDTTSGTGGASPTNRWCRPEGQSPVGRVGDSCNPVAVTLFDIQFNVSDSLGLPGSLCNSCPTSSGGGIFGNNGFVVVTA